MPGGGDLELEPCDRAGLAREGRVLHPTVAAAEAFGDVGSSRFAATVDDGTELAEKRVRRVFYPVWRVSYEHHGRLYRVTVDGVTGATMGARGPQDDRARVLWLIGAALFTALIAGGLARFVAGAISSGVGDDLALELLFGSPIVVGLVGVVVLGFALAVVGVAWEQYRYPGELVIRGDVVDVEKLNAPPKSGLMRFASRLSEGFGSGGGTLGSGGRS